MSTQHRDVSTGALPSSPVTKTVSAAGVGLAAAACGDAAEAAPIVVPVAANYTFVVTEADHDEMVVRIRRQSFSTGLEAFVAGGGGPGNSISQIFLSLLPFFDDTTMGGVFVDRTSFDEPRELSVQGGMTTTVAAKSFDFTELIPASVTPENAEKEALLAFNIDVKTGEGDGHFFDTGEPRIAGFTFYNGSNEHAALMVLDISVDTINQVGTVSVDRIVYESEPGVPLPASAANIPEPGSAALAMLAAGATGLARRRRARAEAEPQSA